MGLKNFYNAKVGDSGLIMVNQSIVELVAKPDQVDVWELKDELTLDEEEKMVKNGLLKPQMRQIAEVCPWVGKFELQSQEDDEVDLSKFVKWGNENINDQRCDTRQCRVCGRVGKDRFNTPKEEVAHRQTPEHKAMMLKLKEKQEFECYCCGVTTADRSEFIAHLRSDAHSRTVLRMYQGVVEGES